MTPQYEIDAIAFIEDRDVTFVYVVRYEPEAAEAWYDIQKIIAQHVTGYTPWRGTLNNVHQNTTTTPRRSHTHGA